MTSILDYLFPTQATQDALAQKARDDEARKRALAQITADQNTPTQAVTADQPDPAAEVRDDVQREPQVAQTPAPAPLPAPRQVNTQPIQNPTPVPAAPQPQATAAPTPLQAPAPIVAPVNNQAASNSDVGILGRMFGYGNQTPDSRGLTPVDRSQLGFSMLAQLGSQLAASGMPMPAPQRAQIIAGMGNIPAQTAQLAQDMVKQRLGGQQLIQQQQKLDALKGVQSAITNPQMMAGLTPAQQALLKGAFMMGDLKTAESLLDPNKNRAKIDANGNISTPDGRIVDSFGRTVYDPKSPAGGSMNPVNQQRPIGYDSNRMSADLQRTGLDGSTLAQIEKEYGPAVAQQVYSWATYKQPFTVSARNGALNNPTGRDAQLMHLVQTVNPNWSPADYQNKQKMWNEFYGSGKTAGNITALDTAYGHIGDLYEAASALKNRDTQGLNSFINKVREQTGDSRITDFSLAGGAVAHELAKVFREQGMSVPEIEAMEKNFSVNSSPAQLQAAITRSLHLMESRVDALKTRYERAGFGAPGDWFTPSHTEKAEYIKQHPLTGAGPASASAPAATGPKAGDIENGYRFKGGNPADASSWERVQ